MYRLSYKFVEGGKVMEDATELASAIYIRRNIEVRGLHTRSPLFFQPFVYINWVPSGYSHDKKDVREG